MCSRMWSVGDDGVYFDGAGEGGRVYQAGEEIGVLITSVQRGSPAARAGIARGDYVIRVNNRDRFVIDAPEGPEVSDGDFFSVCVDCDDDGCFGSPDCQEADTDTDPIRLAPAAQWITERYPVDEVTEPDADGWVTARLPVASERWFVRTMLRLGPDAEVVEPAGAGAPVAASPSSTQ